MGKVMSLAMDYSSCKDRLRKIRKDGTRDPQVVMQSADVLLPHRGSLGDEAWTILEQDAMAALDMHQYARAEKNIKELRGRFGDESVRISILEGMLLETRMEWAEATKLYSAILEEDPCHQLASKRLVAIAKGKGETEKAVELLKEYLELHMADADAWIDLASIYVATCEYRFAAFCYEDLILLQPYNWLYHIKYAEVLYSMGGNDNVELAKKEYMQAYELKPDSNARALYGICLCASTLGAGNYGKQSSAHIKRDLLNEFEWASAKLKELYTSEKANTWKHAEVGLQEMKGAIKVK